MADFLADKILKRREPRVWGIKDWVAGENDLNRQIVERLLLGKSREEYLPGLKYGVKYGRQQQQQEQYAHHQEASVLGHQEERHQHKQHEQHEQRHVQRAPVIVGQQIGVVEEGSAEMKGAYGQPKPYHPTTQQGHVTTQQGEPSSYPVDPNYGMQGQGQQHQQNR